MTLRVLTYNVRSLRDDPHAVARVIRSATANVVCIQEAPRFLRWRSKCAELARRAGLVVVAGGSPAAGNMIFSTLGVDVLATQEVLLSPEPGLHRRGIALAHLRLGGKEFAIAGTHLDLRLEPRLRHVDEIEKIIAASLPSHVPTILCADTNDDPGSATWRALTRSRDDAYQRSGAATVQSESFTADDPPGATSGPNDRPRRRLDAVFVPAAVPVISASEIRGVDVDRASDHRPVLVELDLV